MKADTPTSTVNKRERTTRSLFKKYSAVNTTFLKDFMEDILAGDRILDTYISVLSKLETSLTPAFQANLSHLFLSESIILSEEEIYKLSNE